MKSIGVMKKLKHKLSKRSLELIYFMYGFSYSGVRKLFGVDVPRRMRHLLKVFNWLQSVLIVTGATCRTSHELLYKIISMVMGVTFRQHFCTSRGDDSYSSDQNKTTVCN